MHALDTTRGTRSGEVFRVRCGVQGQVRLQDQVKGTQSGEGYRVG